MNGINKITERIRLDAEQEINTLAAENKVECDKILAKYKDEAQAIYWRVVSEGKQEAERRVELRRGAAQTESKKRMLQLKQDMVALCFEKAEEKLLHLPEAEYEAFLCALAVRAAESGREELIFNAADRERLGQRVTEAANAALQKAGKTGELRLSAATRPIEGGLIVSGGRVETNCSVKTLLELRRSELAGEVAKLLFE